MNCSFLDLWHSIQKLISSMDKITFQKPFSVNLLQKNIYYYRPVFLTAFWLQIKLCEMEYTHLTHSPRLFYLMEHRGNELNLVSTAFPVLRQWRWRGEERRGSDWSFLIHHRDTVLPFSLLRCQRACLLSEHRLLWMRHLHPPTDAKQRDCQCVPD